MTAAPSPTLPPAPRRERLVPAQVPTSSHLSPWSLRPAEARPVAALRLAGRDYADVAEGLHEAGFSVLDILRHGSGPAPLVLVLELPSDDEAVHRLLAAGARGPARVLLVDDRDRLAGLRLRGGVDQVVEWPCHPFQVAAAALRVGGAPEWRLARWGESLFDELALR